MTCCLKMFGMLAIMFLQMSLAQAATELPPGNFPCRLQQITSGVNVGSDVGNFEVVPAVSESMIGTLGIERQTYTTNNGSGEYSFDGTTGALTWLSGPLEGWNSRLEQNADGSFTVRFAAEREAELTETRLTGDILCDLPGAAGETPAGSSTTRVNESTHTPLAGDYHCLTSSFTFSPVQGPAGPLLIVQFSPSALGTITLDGEGNYRVGDNTGTYVYSPASGFTFTRGSLAGWPTIFDTYDSGLELRLSSSQDEPPSPEGGSVGEHVCRLEVPGFTAVTNSSTDAAEATQPGSINGGFTGTLTFRDNWTNEMIDDLDLATGRVSGRFAGNDPHRNAKGETVFINEQGTVVIVDAQGLVITTFPSDDNGSEPQRPVFSHDGSLVAYTLGNPYYETHVIVRGRDGTKVADFTNLVDPSWTPDGRLVMASNTQYQDAPVGIFLSDAALTTTTRIDPNLDEAHDPAVSPDGQTVAFVYHGQIWLMGIDGSNPRQLAPFDGGAHSPAWSPDGGALVVLDREYGTPFLVSLDGQVTEVQTAEGSSIQVNGQISWQ